MAIEECEPAPAVEKRESKHTPGPWFADYCKKGDFWWIDSYNNPGNKGIADLYHKTYGTIFKKENDEANAKLMAKSPELLEVLEDIVLNVLTTKENMSDPWIAERVRRAQEIIREARGEKS